MTIDKTNLLRNLYLSGNSTPKQLAKQTLDIYHSGEPYKFPINVFDILRDFRVLYKFSELDALEGAYSPGNSKTPAKVLINSKRGLSRQRYTGAHELCHHLKDYNREILCPLSAKDAIERFADKYAEELLMPIDCFCEEADKLKNEDGKVDSNKAYQLCYIFGVSYQAAIWKLHRNDYLSFVPSNKFFRKAKPQKKLDAMGQGHLLENIVDSYAFIHQDSSSPLWYIYKNELVFNDNRIEGLKASQEEVSETITDIRLFGKESEYYKQAIKTDDGHLDSGICEVIGHSYIYEYIISTKELPNRVELQELCKLLYALAPYGVEAGDFRTEDNFVTGAKFETTPASKIEEELYYVDKDIDSLIGNKEKFSISEYMKATIKIHHKLTQIHPFSDGNGRTTRALMNWLLKLRSLPPVYINYKDKAEYLSCLEKADEGNYDPLFTFFLIQLLNAFIKLNDELSLTIKEDYLDI